MRKRSCFDAWRESCKAAIASRQFTAAQARDPQAEQPFGVALRKHSILDLNTTGTTLPLTILSPGFFCKLNYQVKSEIKDRVGSRRYSVI